MTGASPAAEPNSPAAEPVEQLGTRVSRGLGWSLIGQGASRGLNFAAGVILARMLAPIDMGEVAAALVVTNIAMAINELGVIPALVRWSGDLRSATATATTIAVVNSLAMYVLAFAAAPIVADVTNTPGSVGVTRIMALVVLVDGVIAVPLAMLYRNLRTVAQVIAEVLGTLVFAVAAVGLAMTGIDANSIAIGRGVGAAATGAVMVAVSWWPARPGFDPAVARRLLAFGFPLAASMAALEAVMSIDYVIVGRELNGASLGVYLIAFSLSSWPVSILSIAIARVSFAGYSALVDEPDRFDQGVAYSFAVAVTFTIPLVVVLIMVSPELVEVVYGSKWEAAQSPLRWLLAVGGLRVLLQLAGEVIAVVGRTMVVLKLRLVWLVLLPPALDFGAEYGGLGGVGMAHAVLAVFVVVPLFLWQMSESGVTLGPLPRYFARPAFSAGVAWAAMALVSLSVDGSVLRLVAIASTGVLAYSVTVVPQNAVLQRLVSQIRGSQGSVV